MLNKENNNNSSYQDQKVDLVSDNANNLKKKPTNISLDVHSMPSTSEESFKTWYILGAVVLFIIIIVFLIFLI